MLSAAVLQPGTALACLPQRCRQPLSQLPTLSQWTFELAQNNRPSARAQATSAQPLVHEQLVSAGTSVVSPAQVPSVLASLQSRQLGRLKPELVDKQGRIMLKNLTKAELVQWLEQQGTVPLSIHQQEHRTKMLHQIWPACCVSTSPRYVTCCVWSTGERPQRAKHLWRWMYFKDHWIRNLDETHGKQNGFGIDFRYRFTPSSTHGFLVASTKQCWVAVQPTHHYVAVHVAKDDFA